MSERPPYQRALTVLAALATAALVASVLAPASAGPAVAAHLALALGALPLILGAIGVFTPTLTQTGPPPRGLALLPAVGALAGGLAVYALRGDLRAVALAAPLGVGAAAGTLAFTATRARAGLGRAHPCLRWYQAALSCSVLALVAIGVAAFAPARWAPLRRVHLHLNLLGFVGLAAVGTLHVLIPTAGGYPDPDARRRLQRGLPFALGGTLGVALGSSAPALRPLAFAGAAAWGVALGDLALAVARRGAAWQRASLPLVAALGGLALALAFGVGVALGLAPRRSASVVFRVGFLLPLITGALAQLLPVWRWPGAAVAPRERARARLVWGGGVRALAFPALGVGLGLELAPGWLRLGVLGLLGVFAAQVVAALGVRSTPPPA
ncbi:MAG: hypothetical protein R3F62_08595 [Planctomycetota bacterium]